MRHTILALFALLCQYQVLAQLKRSDRSKQKFKDSSRFRSPSYDAYRKGYAVIGGTPEFVFIRDNATKNSGGGLGYQIKCIYFPADRIAVGITTGAFSTWSNIGVSSRYHTLGITAQYYFFERKRVTLYMGVRLDIMRFQYKPKQDWQFFSDSVDGIFHTHFIPFLIAPIGVNIKLGRRVTGYYGLGYTRAIISKPYGRLPVSTPIYYDFGINTTSNREFRTEVKVP